jgi:hypothetical protein
MLVVDDLFTDINWSAIEFKGLFHGNDRTVYAGAISAWRCK